MLKRRRRKGERGQALVEFLLFIPVLMTLFWFMVQVNMAINTSLVGQKHARALLFTKMFNHRSGPGNSSAHDLDPNDGSLSDLGSVPRSAYFISVARTVVQGTGQTYEAPYVSLGMGVNPTPRTDADDSPGIAEAGTMRQKVRIRTSYGICTHRKFDPSTNRLTAFCGE